MKILDKIIKEEAQSAKREIESLSKIVDYLREKIDRYYQFPNYENLQEIRLTLESAEIDINKFKNQALHIRGLNAAKNIVENPHIFE
jgi:hypothetical protein